MLSDNESDDLRARIAEVEARRVPLNAVMGWFWPWIIGGVLALICIGGLWCAASAADDGTYAVGLAGAALALLALLWELHAAFTGNIDSAQSRLLVDDAEPLVVLIALLFAMALGGLILAARGETPATSGAGYGLCIFAIVFAFANLKHYFDRREN